jgi:hypothetical protein
VSAVGAAHPPAATVGTTGGGGPQPLGAATGGLAPQREGLAASPMLEGTDVAVRAEFPLAVERLELTPRGFFLKSFSNLSTFE